MDREIRLWAGMREKGLIKTNKCCQAREIVQSAGDQRDHNINLEKYWFQSDHHYYRSISGFIWNKHMSVISGEYQDFIKMSSHTHSFTWVDNTITHKTVLFWLDLVNILLTIWQAGTATSGGCDITTLYRDSLPCIDYIFE